MSTKPRPPWPLYRWPQRGETVAHAACREWGLPCPCCSPPLPPVPPEESECPSAIDMFKAALPWR